MRSFIAILTAFFLSIGGCIYEALKPDRLEVAVMEVKEVTSILHNGYRRKKYGVDSYLRISGIIDGKVTYRNVNKYSKITPGKFYKMKTRIEETSTESIFFMLFGFATLISFGVCISLHENNKYNPTHFTNQKHAHPL